MQSEDYATAQSIVDAAGVTVPTGDLCQGAYDEQGVLYRLPRCIVSDPDNMVDGDGDGDGEGIGTDDDGSEDGSEDMDVDFETEADGHHHEREREREHEHDTDGKTGYGIGIGEGVDSSDELIGAGAQSNLKHDETVLERELERRRDEKGKTSERDLIQVKARLSIRDGVDIVVAVKNTQNVSFLARKLQHEIGVSRVSYLLPYLSLW